MALHHRALVIALLLAVVSAACVGTAPGTQDTAETDAPSPSQAAGTDTEPDGTPTMGEIPPMSEETKAKLDEIRDEQAAIESYHAVVTQRTVVQLSNGSELSLVRNYEVWMKYTENGTLARIESWSPDSPADRRIYVRNRTASMSYDPDDDVYRIDRDRGADEMTEADQFRPEMHTEAGAYVLFDAPFATIERENAVEYTGTETVNGREADVLHLDGNPKGGNLAYYDAQTYWVDAETGLVLKQTMEKPRTDAMQNVTVEEYMGDRQKPGETDAPDAVYVGDKTITTTYTDVRVDSVSEDVFTLGVPEDATVEETE